MTYLMCLRLTYLKGFFWGDRFISYGRRWGCKNTRSGWGRFQQTYARALADGKYSSARTSRRPYAYGLAQNLGLALLRYNLALVPKLRPWAWALVRQLRIRSYKSSRYKLGLPANGQRTHSNANTTGRVADEGARFIRKRRLAPRVWESRKPARASTKSTKTRGNPKGAKAKATTKSGKTVRSKKKINV